MTLFCGLVAVLGWWLAPPGGRSASVVLGAPVAAGPVATRSLGLWVEDARRRGLVCAAGLGLLVAAVVGVAWTPTGVIGGVVLSWALGRLEPASVARRRAQLLADLPLAADLLAASARVGVPIVSSLRVVIDAVEGPVGDELAMVDARIRLGSDPVTEWRRLQDHPQLASLARAIVRSIESGAPVADSLDRFSDDCRRELRMQAQVRARSVGVKCAGPLAACFLPAFVAIGIVPTVAAAFGRLVIGA
jgi:Flp pilus assembly protein TadB